MNGLRLALAGLVAASCLPAAFGDQPFYGSTAHQYPGPIQAGYSADCMQCGGGGYGYGTPGCCDRPISNAGHIWDGYCAEKSHGWFGNRCDNTCRTHCDSGVGGLLFSLKRNRCSSCTSGAASCKSCTAGCSSAAAAYPSCTAGGNSAAAPAYDLDALPAAPTSEPPQPPEPPQASRIKFSRSR